MYKLFPAPNPNPYVPSSIKTKEKLSATAMAEGSLSPSRLLKPYEDRPVIVFSGFNWFKRPSVTELKHRQNNGVIETQIEWYSIEVPDTDAEQKQKLNPFSVTEVERLRYFAVLDSSICCISHYTTHCTDQVWKLDLTGCIDRWQPTPSSSTGIRVLPQKVILNGKLYFYELCRSNI